MHKGVSQQTGEPITADCSARLERGISVMLGRGGKGYLQSNSVMDIVRCDRERLDQRVVISPVSLKSLVVQGWKLYMQ